MFLFKGGLLCVLQDLLIIKIKNRNLLLMVKSVNGGFWPFEYPEGP